MGCSESSQTVAPSRSKVSLTKPKLRESLILNETLAFNSVSALFMAQDRFTSKSLYARISLLKGKSVKPLKQKVDSICRLQSNLTHLVPYKSVYQSPRFYYLVMENWGYETLLESIIKHNFVMTEAGLCNALKGVFNTLAEMHKGRLVHGQISPTKVLLRENTCYLLDITTGMESIGDLLAEDPCYLAPEVLNGESPSPESDVWAIGAVIYYLIAGHTVYPTAPPVEYVKLALSTEPFFRDPVWAIVSHELLELVQKMLERDKKKRISMQKVLESEWVKRAARVDKLIDYGHFFSKNMNSKRLLTKAINLLANEKTKQGLNDLREELTTLDYMKTGMVSLKFLMEKVLDPYHEILSDLEKTDLQANYATVLSNAVMLNELVVSERLAALFYRLSKGGEYINDKEIRQVMCTYGHSVLLDDVKKYKELIKARQDVKREEANLNYDEFIKLFEEWNCNIPEGLIYVD